MWFWKKLPALYTCTTYLSFNFHRIQLFSDICLITTQRLLKRPQALLQLNLETFYKGEKLLTWLTLPKCCNRDVQVVKNRYNLLVVSKRENMDCQAYVISSAINVETFPTLTFPVVKDRMMRRMAMDHWCQCKIRSRYVSTYFHFEYISLCMIT